MDNFENRKTEISKVLQLLTKRHLFNLILYLYDKRNFGNELVFLTSDLRLNLSFIKDRDPLDFRCKLKLSKPEENLFLKLKGIVYSEDYYEAQSRFSEAQSNFIFGSDGWISINDIFAIINANFQPEYSTFPEMIRNASVSIIDNIESIKKAFDDVNFTSTLIKLNQIQKRRMGENLKEIHRNK